MLPYLVYLPEDYQQHDQWPLLLFLHGSGEAGDDLEKVSLHGPPKQIREGRAFPFIVVSPQNPPGKDWQPTELAALLDHIESEYKVDRQRIYLTGLSLGGYGVWSLANHQPQRFAAIAPVCGGGDIRWAKRLAALNVWAFHGEQDNVVPVSNSVNMVNALKRYGGQPRLTIYPDVGHDAWTPAYEQSGIYEWLLRHSL